MPFDPKNKGLTLRDYAHNHGETVGDRLLELQRRGEIGPEPGRLHILAAVGGMATASMATDAALERAGLDGLYVYRDLDLVGPTEYTLTNRPGGAQTPFDAVWAHVSTPEDTVKADRLHASASPVTRAFGRAVVRMREGRDCIVIAPDTTARLAVEVLTGCDAPLYPTTSPSAETLLTLSGHGWRTVYTQRPIPEIAEPMKLG